MPYEIRKTSRPSFTRRIRTKTPRLWILHATRGHTSLNLQDDATLNWFRNAPDRGGWGSTADVLISADDDLIWEFGDIFREHSAWSAGYGGLGPSYEYGADEWAISIELAQTDQHEPFSEKVIDKLAWYIRERSRDFKLDIPAVHVTSWDQRRNGEVPTGFIGHDETANGRKTGKCIAADTPLMAVVDGHLTFARAEDVLTHEDVLLPCVEGSEIEWRKPLDRERRIDQTHTISIRGATPIRATAEHKWAQFTHRGQFHQGRGGRPSAERPMALWRTDELHDGFQIPRRMHLPRPAEFVDAGALYDYDIGYLTGAWVAEGSYVQGKPNTLRLSLGPQDRAKMLPRIKETVTGLLHDNWGEYESKASRGFTVHAYGGVTAAVVRKFVSGRTSKTKRLTQDVWAMPDVFLAGLMDGYLDGDGHEVEPGHFSLGMTNNQGLMDDLCALALLLGYEFRQQKMSVVNGHEVLNGSIRTAPMVEHAGDGMRGVYGHRTVRSVEPTTVEPVWDVTVGGSGLFVLGNGLVTHNSDPGKQFPWAEFLRRVEGAPVSIPKIDIAFAYRVLFAVLGYSSGRKAWSDGSFEVSKSEPLPGGAMVRDTFTLTRVRKVK